VLLGRQRKAENRGDKVAGPRARVAGTGSCASPGVALPTGALNDRCGFGVRLPFLVISPFAKPNYVDHSLNDITSILRFIEYNWNLGTIGDPQ
jgi:phospholipase C